VSRIRKKTFYLQFCMGTPEGHKDTYGTYLTKFASSTQKHKKVIKIPNQPIEIKKSEKKAKIRLGAT
jgi:hypothetical protein